jgi:hypothetical protein
VAASAAAVPGGGRASEWAGLSPTTAGGLGSHSTNDQSSSPELQKDLRLRMQQHHPVDIIISDRDRFVFVDNVKAASTTLRELLSKELNVTWWDGCDGVYRRCCSTLGRTTTACLDEQHASYFVFGFARHPAVKFESGAPPWLDASRPHTGGCLPACLPACSGMLPPVCLFTPAWRAALASQLQFACGHARKRSAFNRQVCARPGCSRGSCPSFQRTSCSPGS